MPVDLSTLLKKFKNIDDCEFEGLVYKTRVPDLAPQAYLNVIFKSGPQHAHKQTAMQLILPASLADFYAVYNGASLFSGAIRIFGFRPTAYLLEREDWFRKRLPHCFVEVNEQYQHELKQLGLLCFADYGYDNSLVCIDRKRETITCFVGEDFEKQRCRWETFDDWIRTEILRISLYFDERGNLLVPEETLLPGEQPPLTV